MWLTYAQAVVAARPDPCSGCAPPPTGPWLAYARERLEDAGVCTEAAIDARAASDEALLARLRGSRLREESIVALVDEPARSAEEARALHPAMEGESDDDVEEALRIIAQTRST